MKKTTLLLLFASLAANVFSQSAPAKDNLTNKPRYCILYIGDGFGTSAKTAARMSLGQGTIGKRFPSDAGFQVLALDKLRFSTSVTTHSANSWITDSGPGASAYAAGEKGKIDNEAISFNVGTNQSVETILEAAKKQGYAVGLITTTRITHATPATLQHTSGSAILKTISHLNIFLQHKNNMKTSITHHHQPSNLTTLQETGSYLCPKEMWK